MFERHNHLPGIGGSVARYSWRIAPPERGVPVCLFHAVEGEDAARTSSASTIDGNLPWQVRPQILSTRTGQYVGLSLHEEFARLQAQLKIAAQVYMAPRPTPRSRRILPTDMQLLQFDCDKCMEDYLGEICRKITL